MGPDSTDVDSAAVVDTFVHSADIGTPGRPLSGIKFALAIQRLKDIANTDSQGRFKLLGSNVIDEQKVGTFLRTKYSDDSIVKTTKLARLRNERLLKVKLTAKRLAESKTEGYFFGSLPVGAYKSNSTYIRISLPMLLYQ